VAHDRQRGLDTDCTDGAQDHDREARRRDERHQARALEHGASQDRTQRQQQADDAQYVRMSPRSRWFMCGRITWVPR
jgi:hypothetical protein